MSKLAEYELKTEPKYIIFSVAQQPKSGLDRIIVEVSISHTQLDTHTAGRTHLNE
jgi:hypothetical protein